MQMSGLRGIASRHGYLVKKIEQSLYNLDDDLGETTDVAASIPTSSSAAEAGRRGPRRPGRLAHQAARQRRAARGTWKP